MLRALPYVLVAALVIYCAFDVLGSDERRRRGLPTPVWLLVLLVPVVGAAVWLVVSRTVPRPPDQRRRPAGPVAPDDDPEFLRRLDQQRRLREQRERAARSSSDDTAPGPGATPDEGAEESGTSDATDGTPSP